MGPLSSTQPTGAAVPPGAPQHFLSTRQVREQSANRTSRRGTPGNPAATWEAVLIRVDSATPPLRVFFGQAPLAIAAADYQSRLKTWNMGSPTPWLPTAESLWTGPAGVAQTSTD